MINIIRFLFLACVLAASSAQALVPQSSGWQTWWDYQYKGAAGGATLDELSGICKSYGDPKWQAAGPPTMQTWADGSGAYSKCGEWVGPTWTDRGHKPEVKRGIGCPPNSTPVTGGCQCSTGYVEQGSQCVDPNGACSGKVGKTDIINWTAGWQRTPSIGDNSPFIAPNNPGPSGSVCEGGCTKQFETFAPCPECRSYVSQQPNAQGLYRVSIEFRGRYTGAACQASATDDPAKPDDSKDPPCPGYVGEVNGVKGCFGTADKPVRPQTNFIPPSTSQQPGNPPAGAAPGGQGGQTPSSGSGGSAGGPAGAAVGPGGSKGTGTVAGSGNGSGRVSTQDGTEQQACGAPGQPVCAVKVDETGVPADATSSFSSATAKVEETKGKADEQLAKASGTADKGFLETARGLFWAPPVAACEAVQLPPQIRGVAANVSIDPCGVVDGGRAIMGFVWAATGLFMCLGMIKRSV